MNKPLICAATALLLTVFSVQATPGSPDGKFRVKTGASIEIVDSVGEPVLVLNSNTAGVKLVEIAWSNDSQRVVIAENFNRGSAIFGAWHDGSGSWHKTLQSDSDQQQIMARIQGRVVSEQRTLGRWTSDNALTIKGQLTVGAGKRVSYTYTLKFEGSQGRLDRGGFEEGVIVGKDYTLL